MRLRKKRNLSERMERCARLLVTTPQALKGRWLDMFTDPATDGKYSFLHIELGCGKGRFAAETAKSSPDVLIAAIERLDGVIIAALERAEAEGLENARYINALADNLADYFAPGEVSRIYINFCDPWPLSRHEKRRLTSRRFLDIYKVILCPGGQLRLKTDNLMFFEFSLLELEACGFEPTEVIRDLHKNGTVGIMTEYEQKFHAKGMPIYSVSAEPAMGLQQRH